MYTVSLCFFKAVTFTMVPVFSLQGQHKETAPIQFDDTSGGEEEHVTGGGVKLGEKNRERPGEMQIRCRKNMFEMFLRLVI